MNICVNCGFKSAKGNYRICPICEKNFNSPKTVIIGASWIKHCESCDKEFPDDYTYCPYCHKKTALKLKELK